MPGCARLALDGDFARAVELLHACRGTGTPALFLHSAEGVHGDLGMIVRGDVMVAIS